ncbi:MAG TPA: hypothetical protein VM778_06380 [Gemmatimonadota bacterium]|nr:hypothetical protein [Gemmatimonadota bacterium]
MRIARVWADEAGITHFDEVEIPLADAGEIGRLSETFPAVGVVFRENDPDYDFDWHPAPRRQLVVLLDGAIEIEVGDGEVRRFAGGDVVLLEDTEGRGHRTRNVEASRRRSLFVALGEGEPG